MIIHAQFGFNQIYIICENFFFIFQYDHILKLTMPCYGSHLKFPVDTKNTHFVKD